MFEYSISNNLADKVAEFLADTDDGEVEDYEMD